MKRYDLEDEPVYCPYTGDIISYKICGITESESGEFVRFEDVVEFLSHEKRVCLGCQREELHKHCPAHGTKFYMSGIKYTEKMQKSGINANDLFDLIEMVKDKENDSR